MDNASSRFSTTQVNCQSFNPGGVSLVMKCSYFYICPFLIIFFFCGIIGLTNFIIPFFSDFTPEISECFHCRAWSRKLVIMYRGKVTILISLSSHQVSFICLFKILTPRWMRRDSKYLFINIQPTTPKTYHLHTKLLGLLTINYRKH